MNGTILITGASGLLGANLVHYFHDRFFRVKVLVRPNADLSTISSIPKEIVYGFIDNVDDVELALQGCEYVVHAASLTTQWGIGFEEYKKINITATQIIANACLKYQIEKLIYVSTANTLAPGSKLQPGTELNAFSLHHINSGYINSKYIALQYIQEQVQLKSLPAVIISPTFMIGAYDVKPSSGQLVLHRLNKSFLPYPSGGKNFVHVDDVCTGIFNAIEKGKIGEHYLIAGHNLSYKEFYELVDQNWGKQRVKIHIPGLLLRTAGRLGDLLQILLQRPLKLNYAGTYMLSLDNYYSGAKAERALDIQYKSIDQAIADALSWFRQAKYC